MIDAHPPPVPFLTRQDALAAWSAFLPTLGTYAQRRNHVEQGHPNVSRLGAALRHRLLSDDEVIRDTLWTHELHTVEKWLQEVCWRKYWKGWLETRPNVWTGWRRRVRELNATLPAATLRRAQAVAAGESGVACMDAIARELITTGYLHNHARMWWAGYWIHAERLPWELGADWFFRHLLDADPASNTLSWRWVAGLQTADKAYVVRLSNLEKYAAASLLADRTGVERIADDSVRPLPVEEFADTTPEPLPDYSASFKARGQRIGLWLHADDLLPEDGPLESLRPVAVAAFSSAGVYHRFYGLSERRIRALHTVMNDAVIRAEHHFKAPARLSLDNDPEAGVMLWAKSHAVDEIVAFAPTVGPIRDMLPRLQRNLIAANVRLTLIRRASDAHAFSLAGRGFFPFWKKMRRHLRTSVVPAHSP